MTGHSTRESLLDVAQHLVQQRGFASVAYRDLGAAMNIRNASIHHHFPTKADLGVALIHRYRSRIQAALTQLSDSEASPARRLERYLTSYQDVIHEDGRICLCTQLVAEDCVLPAAMQQELDAYFTFTEQWLTRTFTEAQRGGDVRLTAPPAETALQFLALTQGAMLMARTARDPQRFHTLTQRALGALMTPRSS